MMDYHPRRYATWAVSGWLAFALTVSWSHALATVAFVMAFIATMVWLSWFLDTYWTD